MFEAPGGNKVDPSVRDEPDERGGIFGTLVSPFLDFAGRSRGHVSDYVRARSELLRIEAEEAATAAKELATTGGLGILLLIPGYTLCLVAALQALSGEWPLSRFGLLALVTGIVHLGLGIAILLRTRAKARATRYFEESREQLKRDQEWLNQFNQTPRPPTSGPGNPD